MASEEAEGLAGLPKPGDTLVGKYLIDRVLGQGGMGVVMAAHHTALHQNVAVKFLLPEVAKRADACERFLREARAAAKIQSEHVTRVSDVGTTDDGAPYMVMELLKGMDLGQLLEDSGPLPIDRAIDHVLQGCQAIAEAHALGLVHRDLKPANLFLTQRADGTPLVKVLDFGLSKDTTSNGVGVSLTAANMLIGSPYFMAPEQIRNQGVDARVDIWAIGVILYQLLTGALPFDAESLGALFMAIGSEPPQPMRPLRPDLPRELEAAIMRCLEKSPAARPQTMGELGRALAPFGTDDAYLSVERIMRVLSDKTPFTRPARSAPAAAAPTGEKAFDPVLATMPWTEPEEDGAPLLATIGQEPLFEAGHTVAVEAPLAVAPVTSIPALAMVEPAAGKSRGAAIAIGVAVLVVVTLAAAFVMRGSGEAGETKSPATSAAPPVSAEKSAAPPSAPSPAPVAAGGAGVAATSAPSGSASVAPSLPKPAPKGVWPTPSTNRPSPPGTPPGPAPPTAPPG
jgi:eukaryotic-like serine/threonine-protein kinase